MTSELKATVINMKTLNQNIDDIIILNAADANGRYLQIIFTQEAASRFTPQTKVYLSWFHQQAKIKGYNVFTEIPREDTDELTAEELPPSWYIYYPQSMLYEGDVLACIELVDEVSIAASKNFIIHVIQDPNDGNTFVKTDDFSEFKQAVLAMNNITDRTIEQLEEQAEVLAGMSETFEQMNETFEQSFAETMQLAEDAWNNSVTAVTIASAAYALVNKESLLPEDITTGSTNGTISVKNVDIPVYGLGSAAYTDSTAYATRVQGNAANFAISALTWKTLE